MHPSLLGRSARTPLLLALAAGLAACASTGPALPERPEVEAEETREEPLVTGEVVEEPEADPEPEVAPEPPRVRRAPPGTVAAQSRYPGAGAWAWTLANGLRVVARPLPEAAGVAHLRLARDGGGSAMPDSLRAGAGWVADHLAGRFADLPGPALDVHFGTYAVVAEARGDARALPALLDQVRELFRGPVTSEAAVPQRETPALALDRLLGLSPPTTGAPTLPPAGLRAWTLGHFDPAAFTLYIAGDVAADSVEVWAAERLATLRSPLGPTRPPAPAAWRAPSREEVRVDRATPGSRVTLAYVLPRTASPAEAAALDVLAGVAARALGAEGMASTAEALVLPSAGLSVLLVVAEATGDADALAASARRLVGRLAMAVPADAVAAARAARADAARAALRTPEGWIAALDDVLRRDADPREAARRPRLREAVTAERVRTLARDVFGTAPYVLIEARP